MKKTLASLLASVLLPVFGIGQQFSSRVVDTNSISSSIGYARDSQGTNHMFYSANNRLYYQKGEAKQQVSFPMSSQQLYSDLKFSRDSPVAVVTSYLNTPTTNNWRIMQVYQENRTWKSREIFSPSSNRCAQLVDGNHQTFLATDDASDDLYLLSASNFTNFPPQISKQRLSRVKSQKNPQIARDKNHRLYALWEESDDKTLKSCTGRITNKGLEDVSELGEFSFDGNISVGSDNSVNVVYKNSKVRPTSCKQVADVVTKRLGSGVEEIIKKDVETPVGKPISSITDSKGMHHVQWTESCSNGLKLVYCNSDDYSKQTVVDEGGAEGLGETKLEVVGDTVSSVANFHSLVYYEGEIKRKEKGTVFIVR